ncbi:MAG: hypothetical protein HKN12_04525, partial [Gemmatimonadetes bacterium]|nr:hypothetical protein [Gemmatimonadota bacterium]
MGRPALPPTARAVRALPPLVLALLLAVSAGPGWAAPQIAERAEPATSAPMVEGRLPLMIQTDDPAGVADRVLELGGRVTHVFRNLGAVSAELTPDGLAALKTDPRVQRARRQHLVHRAIVPSRLPDVPGYSAPRKAREGALTLDPPSAPQRVRTLPLKEVAAELGKRATGTQSFFGYDVLTGAADSW